MDKSDNKKFRVRFLWYYSAGILERLWGLGTSCRTSPPAYVAWRAYTTTLFLLGS
jgi:hypothetical protein